MGQLMGPIMGCSKEFKRNHGKERGNYCSTWRLNRDDGKEHGNYYLGFRA